MDESPIYTITTIERALASGKRAVGFFHEFDYAEKAVIHNMLDINEMGYYPFVVIEKTEPGFYTYPREEFWYQWNRETKCYERIEKPERFRQVVGWGLG
jgi:hypothetical protein